MNDVYTGFFIIAAYAVFAWLWIDPRRPRWAFWTLMPVIGVLLGLALASKWVAAYAIGALGILILARSALGRLVLILGHDRPDRRAGLDGDGRPGGQRRLREPAVHADHDRADPRDRRRQRVPPDRVVGRGDVARGRGAGGPRDPRGARLDHPRQGRQGRTPSGPSSSRRSRSRSPCSWPRSSSTSRFQVAGRLGFGPMAPAPGPGRPARQRPAGVPARDRLAAARLGARHPGRLDAGLAARDPARGVRDLVHPVGADRGPPAHRGLAAGPHGPDAARPHRRDVPVPQRPDRAPRGELAVVGLAAEPQAGLVLPGQLRELDGGLHLRRGQRGAVVDGHPRDGVRRLPGVQAPQPAADADPGRLPVPVDLVGPHRPGRVPVPLLHEPAVRVHGARLLHRRAVARAVAADVAAGAGRRRARAVRADHPVADPQAGPVQPRERRGGQPGIGGVPRRSRQPRRDPLGGGAGDHRDRDPDRARAAPHEPRPAATGRLGGRAARPPAARPDGDRRRRADRDHPGPPRPTPRCSPCRASCPSSSR